MSINSSLVHRIASNSSNPLSCLTIIQRTLSTTSHAFSAVTYEARSDELDEQPSTSRSGTLGQEKIKWDWKWVLGKTQGRKPAIRRPGRHQWYFCNPNYDPNQPLPVTFRSPFAPPSAWKETDLEEYQRHVAVTPPKGRDLRKHRKEFTRFVKLRELDWREAFQRGVAEDLRRSRKAERLEAEAKRQEAWRQYRDALFERARLAGEDVTSAPSVATGSAPDLSSPPEPSRSEAVAAEAGSARAGAGAGSLATR